MTSCIAVSRSCASSPNCAAGDFFLRRREFAQHACRSSAAESAWLLPSSRKFLVPHILVDFVLVAEDCRQWCVT